MPSFRICLDLVTLNINNLLFDCLNPYYYLGLRLNKFFIQRIFFIFGDGPALFVLGTVLPFLFWGRSCLFCFGDGPALLFWGRSCFFCFGDGPAFFIFGDGPAFFVLETVLLFYFGDGPAFLFWGRSCFFVLGTVLLFLFWGRSCFFYFFGTVLPFLFCTNLFLLQKTSPVQISPFFKMLTFSIFYVNIYFVV